jgi:hypothetical protein
MYLPKYKSLRDCMMYAYNPGFRAACHFCQGAEEFTLCKKIGKT